MKEFSVKLPVEELKNEISNDVTKNVLRDILPYLKESQLKDEKPQFLSINEVSEMLSITRVTLWKLTKTGKIKGYRIGGNVRYKMSDIQDAVKLIA